MKTIADFLISCWKEILIVFAFLLSVINFWYAFLIKGSPIFSCSKWTAIQMIKNDLPHAAFALQISVYNKGKVPLQVYDFVLKAKTSSGQSIVFEALLLWDLRQWIEDGNRTDKVGRAQKGQVPLPLIVTPGQLYDFGYHLFFFPVDKISLIDPNSTNGVELSLFAKTDRSEEYELIGSQNFTNGEIKDVLTKSFVSVVSSESMATRQELISRIK